MSHRDVWPVALVTFKSLLQRPMHHCKPSARPAPKLGRLLSRSLQVVCREGQEGRPLVRTSDDEMRQACWPSGKSNRGSCSVLHLQEDDHLGGLAPAPSPTYRGAAWVVRPPRDPKRKFRRAFQDATGRPTTQSSTPLVQTVKTRGGSSCA